MTFDMYRSLCTCICFNMAESGSENEEVLESGRRKRIQELVRNIGATKKPKKQKLMGKDTHLENPKKRPRGTGRHPMFKLQIGWLHQTRGKYRQVTARRGGGTRVYEFNRDDEQTVETVTNYAKRIFFPDGKNDMGELADMEVTLSSYNGEAIEKFTGNDGTECCLQDYLKTIGVYSSQYYLYLRTSKKPLSEEPPSEEPLSEGSLPVPSVTSLTVNGRTPGEICVHYTKTCHSSYTEELSQKTCFTIDDCFNDTCVNAPDTERNKYNPLENDFKVTGLTVNQITLLSCSNINSNKFEYPTATQNSKGVIHIPDQVMGFENSQNKQLLLGVLYKEHNSGANFQWYRNREEFASGIDLCIIPATETGEYVVNVSDNETLYECGSVSVEAQGLLTDHLSASNSSQDIPQNTAGLTTRGLLTDNLSASNSSQDIPQSTAGLTPQGLLTHNLSASNSSRDIPQNTAGLTTQGLLTDYLSASNSSLEIPQNTAGFTTQGLQSYDLSASNSSQDIPQNMAGLTTQGLPTDYLSASNSSQDIPQNTACLTTQGLLTDYLSASNLSQDIPQNMAGLTTQGLQTDNLSASNSSQDIPQNTAGLTTRGLPTDHLSASNSSQDIPQNTAGFTTQGLQTNDLSASNSSQDIPQNTAGLTTRGLLTDYLSASNSSQDIPQNTAGLTTRGLLTDHLSASNSSQDISQNTAGLTTQGLLTDNLSASNSSQDIPQNTAGLTTQGLLTDNLSASYSSQAIPQNTAGLTTRGLLTDHSMPRNTSQTNLPNLSTDSNVPEIPFDSLHIGPKIGEGSFGTVHKAHWLFTPVAVKTVKIRRMKLVQKALAREVNVLSRVRHPNILLFLAYAIKNNALHIVSEYIEGSDLDDLLFGNKCQQIPLPKKCCIAEKFSQAVAYLHNSSPTILHRDIKPDNIILTHTFETVKLCDLGISKLVTINSSATTYAQGMQPGTPIFQAPEILLGNTPASTKSDVWGMAGTLVELFSESPMWDIPEEDEDEAENSLVETIKILMRQKEVPHAIRRLSQMDSIPKTVEDIITKGLNYDPDSRPSSIEFPTQFSI